MNKSYQQHTKDWKNCKKCDLRRMREHVVLLRGSVPCDVLFIGEAPGVSEDILGKPFIGPAGKLLDRIIKAAGVEGTYAFSNLVACIPLDEDCKKVSQPPKKAIKECSPRLREIVDICNPDFIVCVGSLAAVQARKIIGDEDVFQYIDIVHPAKILRMNPAQQGLEIQATIITLQEELDGLNN